MSRSVLRTEGEFGVGHPIRGQLVQQRAEFGPFVFRNRPLQARTLPRGNFGIAGNADDRQHFPGAAVRVESRGRPERRA